MPRNVTNVTNVTSGRKLIGARIDGALYQQFKRLAFLHGLTTGQALEQATREWMLNHPAPNVVINIVQQNVQVDLSTRVQVIMVKQELKKYLAEVEERRQRNPNYNPLIWADFRRTLEKAARLSSRDCELAELVEEAVRLIGGSGYESS